MLHKKIELLSQILPFYTNFSTTQSLVLKTLKKVLLLQSF
jgi:hypothetical protein